ncbi:hypothetical protein Tco_0441093 [Tanacetum coccineum]
MMTYFKAIGKFKHAELKIKKFEEVQALYEKINRSDEDFISIGSAKDERLIKKMNEKGVDSSKDDMIKEKSKEEVKEESKAEVEEEGKEEENKNRGRKTCDKENDELRLYLTIAPDEEKEVDYEILDRKYPIKEWKTECLGTKPQTDQAEHLEEINLKYLNVVYHTLDDKSGVLEFTAMDWIIVKLEVDSSSEYIYVSDSDTQLESEEDSLVPQGQKASDYDNSDPVPPRQNVVPTAEKTDSSQQGLEFLLSPLLEEYYNLAHGHAEDNNNDQAPNASFQEAEFINPFYTRVQEIGEPSSRNIDNTDVHSFQPQSHDYRWTRVHQI